MEKERGIRITNVDKKKQCDIPVVIVPKGTLCDGMCKVEATINAKEQCIRCGITHKE